MKALVVIVIIAHKSVLSKNEENSLLQCHKIFEHYPIKLICPEGLNILAYKEIYPKIDVEFIDDKWQSDYAMFNLLKIDQLLYKKFKAYKYILFYELDAWVFRNELKYWCEKGYDFIGAPWFEGDFAGKSTNVIGIGNGGFSLRNTASSLRLFKRIQLLKKIRKFWYTSRLQSLWRVAKVISAFNKYFKVKEPAELNQLLLLKEMTHEDRYWAKVGRVFNDFNIAPIEDALRFSFEVQPTYLFKKNNNQLPFGCHAWERCEPGFWKAYIPFESQSM